MCKLTEFTVLCGVINEVPAIIAVVCSEGFEYLRRGVIR